MRPIDLDSSRFYKLRNGHPVYVTPPANLFTVCERGQTVTGTWGDEKITLTISRVSQNGERTTLLLKPQLKIPAT